MGKCRLEVLATAAIVDREMGKGEWRSTVRLVVRRLLMPSGLSKPREVSSKVRFQEHPWLWQEVTRSRAQVNILIISLERLGGLGIHPSHSHIIISPLISAVF